MVKFNFTYDASVGLEQRVGFEMAAAIWASVLTDSVAVNLHVGATTGLDNGNAVGGAIPILHKQTYGVFKEYYKGDITSAADRQANASMQVGNTVDLAIGGEVIDGNTSILLTSAQAKAMGMGSAITLGNGTTWNRNLVDPNALDGYIVVNNSFDWSYDFTRSGEADAEKLDFISMALHEIGHNLGFVSGLDGAMDVLTLHSGKARIEDFTALDLFRHTVDTAKIENGDGSVSSVGIGGNAYFSIDGGKTNLADFSTGKDTEKGGDGFQASHWKRLQNAMGIMDPTLAYKERLSLSALDLQALDVLGWNVNYQSAWSGLDFDTLLLRSEQAVAASLGLDSSIFENSRTDSHLYSLSHDQLLGLMKDQMLSLGYSRLWQAFELGYSRLWQEQESAEDMLQLGYSRLWQELESQLLALGYSRMWQEFQEEMFELGYSRLWQAFELSYSRLWQELDPHLNTVRNADSGQNSNGSVIDHSGSGKSVVVSGGDADDILAGSGFRDLVSGGGGDDLIDGKNGNDTLMGEAGNDILYGGDGDDKLYGGDGDDVLAGEAGDDKLYGEAGADILSGGYGNDLLDGGSGDDQLRGDAGNDVLDGGEGNDDLDGGEGNDIIIGGEGEDSLSGGRGDDVLYGDQYIASSVENGKGNAAGLEEISAKAGFTTTGSKPSIDFWVRLEAEDLRLRNFSKEESRIASGNGLIATGGEGDAKTKFSGPTGTYDIVVGYYDEKDGKGELKVEVGDKKDKQKFEWLLDRELHNEGVGSNNFTTYTIRGVHIKSGEELKIKGEAEGSEFIRVDYIDIISTTQGTAFADAQFYNGSFYLQSQDKSTASSEATALGGELLIKAQKDSAEEYWLENTLGKSENIIKVDVSDSQFNLLVDDAARNAGKALRIEAESFELSNGYRVEGRSDFASGKAVIAGNYGSRATSVFTGESGVYDIFVSYVDEDNGIATAAFGINGKTLNQWNFDAVDDVAIYRTVGTQIALKKGDSIELKGWSDKNDKARIDYVEFVASATSDDTPGADPTPLQQVRIEAENVSWGGKVGYKNQGYASGQALVEVEKNAYTNTTFNGESGLYSIALGYSDEKGEGKLSAWLGGNSLGTWDLSSSGKDQITTQTLVTEVLIKNGQQLSFQTGEKKIKLDYIDFTPVVVAAPNLSDDLKSVPTGEVIFIEAENMQLSGKAKAESKNAQFASNGGYVKLDGDIASTLFMGETGYYDVVIGYYDIGKGNAELTVKLNEEALDSWVLDKSLSGEKSASASNFVTRTIASGIELTRASDVLQIINRKDSEDKGYVDYIKLVKVERPVDRNVVVNTDTSTNSDVLRGGQGNDIIYGGAGNDLIYGEDEFDNGLGSASNTSDIIYGGSGNDRIYGNSGNDRLYGDYDSSAAFLSDGGEGGDDYLEGGRGNDYLEGGIGDDRLDGSDATALGKLEIDTLVGGGGADQFILGSAKQSYYIGGGNSDYALIKDFNAAVDVLQLNGSAGNYQQQRQGSNLLLSHGQDLIAILENTSELNLNSTAVRFV